MVLKPISTEKAVRLIDSENTLVFETGRNARKEDIKKDLETLLNVKIVKIRTNMRSNRKFVYVRLDKKFTAADVATKLGMI